MSVVVTGAFQVVQEGLQLFKTNQMANDSQSSAIKTLSKLTTEMVNAHPDLVEIYSATDPTDESGVVFASPLNVNGLAQFNSDTGKVYWQFYVCYYYVPHPSRPAHGKLYRKEQLIPSELGIEPGRTGDSNLNDVEAGMPDLDSFVADGDLPTRILGETVSGFELTLFEGQITDGDGSTKDVLGGSSVTDRQDTYDIVLETGDKNNDGPNGYYIQVNSRVTPRG
jgi:hypothetical protein